MCTIECAGAAYEERHNSVVCCSTYGQVVFGVQCVGLNGVYIDIFVQLNLNNFNAVFYILTYADILVTIEVNIIARLYLSSCCYSTINRQIPTFVSVIRCRISSHRRSHACTGHNTCCNQHCQQLFGRAAFTAMIFCDFGDNNISVACFAPNYFKNFVHQKFLPLISIFYIMYAALAACGNKLNNYCINYPAPILLFFSPAVLQQHWQQAFAKQLQVHLRLLYSG